MKLFLKGDRCYTKCPMDKPDGAFPPGQHAMRRSKPTEYARRLREKQRLRRLTSTMERQFYRYFTEARKTPGSTGQAFLQLLETRLDNVVRRFGFSTSLAAARQLVLHGHILVNGHRVSIPSQAVRPEDRVELAAGMRNNAAVQKSLRQALARGGVPSWLEWEGGLEDVMRRAQDTTDLSGTVIAGRVRALPGRAEMSFPVNEQLIIELYSK